MIGLRTHPDPILYQRAEPLTDEQYADGTADRIAQELLEAMRALEANTGMRAAGLSAPQIGYGLRLFRLAQWPGAFCNPELVCELGRPVTEDEQCFSIPGLTLPVARAVKVKLRYRTVAGGDRATKMRDRDARAAQHEYDHLNGVTIIQRAEHVDIALP